MAGFEPAESGGRGHREETSEQSYRAQVKRILADDQPWSSREIAYVLGTDKNTTRSVLAKMRKKGEVEKNEWGLWVRRNGGTA